MKITSDSTIRISFDTAREAKVLRRLLLFTQPLEGDDEGDVLLKTLLDGMNQHLYPVGASR